MPRQGEQNDMEFARKLIELGRELGDLPEDLQKVYMGRGDEGPEESIQLVEPAIQTLAIEPISSEPPATLGVASMSLMSTPPAPSDPAIEAAQSKVNFARSLKNGAKTLETLMNKASDAKNVSFASTQIKNAITKMGGLIQDSKNQAFYDDSESLKSTVASLEAMMNELNEFLQSGNSSDKNVIKEWKDKAASILEGMRATSQSLSEEAKNEMQAAEEAFNKAKKLATRADKKEDKAEKLDKRAEKLADRADNPNKTEDEAKKLAEKAKKLAARADKKEDKAEKLDKRAEKLADRSDKKEDKAKKLDDRADKIAKKAADAADEAAKQVADANSNDNTDIPATDSDVTPDVDTDPADALTPTADDTATPADTLVV